MFKKILLGLLAIVAIILIVAAFQPNTYHVERSANVAAPPEAVYAQVNDFHNWPQFNPFQQLDPNAKVRYEGHEKGEGSTFFWEGNSQMGKGSMTITKSTPYERLDILMHFDEPMEGDAGSAFIIKPNGSGTHVIWSMDGKNNYISKVMCLFMDMDKMIGGEYEKGLAKLGELPAAH